HKRLNHLEAWMRERFPDVNDVRFGWSGQVYEPADYVPFIGLNPGHKKIFVITGDSGSGLTMGVAASLILPDVMMGKKHEWADVYDPSRPAKSAPALGQFMTEIAGAAAHLVEHALP